jgi:uncharacterized membrane protein YcjF (UPF0283 family)
MFLRKVSLLLFVLILSIQFVVAAPVHPSDLGGSTNQTRQRRSSESATGTPSRTLDWNALKPLLATVGALSLLAGVVFVGTKLDESYRRAVEAHKKEKFQRIVSSDAWRKGDNLPSSINEEEDDALRRVGAVERQELAREEIRHNKKVESLKQDVIVKYFDEVEKIQEAHRKKRVQDE